MRRGQICGPGTARPLPRPRHLAEDPRGCAAAGTPQVQQPLASRRLLLCLCLRVHFGHYQQGSQIVPSTLADSGRNRRSLPIQWSRPIWFWCSLHACSDAPVRRDSARHYAVRFCPWSRDIFAGTGVKAQVVAERYRTEQRTLNPRVRGSSPWRRTRSDLGFCHSRSFFMCPFCPHAGSVVAENLIRPGGSGRSVSAEAR